MALTCGSHHVAISLGITELAGLLRHLYQTMDPLSPFSRPCRCMLSATLLREQKLSFLCR